MPKAKKDAKYLNVHIERQVYDDFTKFCKKFGFTKTGATELALKFYMEDVESKMKGRHEDAK